MVIADATKSSNGSYQIIEQVTNLRLVNLLLSGGWLRSEIKFSDLQHQLCENKHAHIWVHRSACFSFYRESLATLRAVWFRSTANVSIILNWWTQTNPKSESCRLSIVGWINSERIPMSHHGGAGGEEEVNPIKPRIFIPVHNNHENRKYRRWWQSCINGREEETSGWMGKRKETEEADSVTNSSLARLTDTCIINPIIRFRTLFATFLNTFWNRKTCFFYPALLFNKNLAPENGIFDLPIKYCDISPLHWFSLTLKTWSVAHVSASFDRSR
jgi:hypothetical protein